MNEVSPGFSCSYHCCLSSGSSFLTLTLFSLKSYMCGEETSLLSPWRSSRKTCANKPNIYASAEVCSPSGLLHEHTGGLLTPPAQGMWGSGWVPDNLEADRGVTQSPFARGITVQLLLWKNKRGLVCRLLGGPKDFGSSSWGNHIWCLKYRSIFYNVVWVDFQLAVH